MTADRSTQAYVQRNIRILLAACMLAMLPACAETKWRSDAHRMVRTELYFGLLRPDGSQIAADQWQRFVDAHVTPRFPDGLTVLDAAGQWRNAAGRIIQEPSKVIIILHGDSAEHRCAIQNIRDTYRRTFDQESVLLVQTRQWVSF